MASPRMAAAAPNSNSSNLPNAPPLLYPYDLGYKFNASMAIIVVVLVTTFFFMALFVLYIRRCNRSSSGAGGGGGQQQGDGDWNRQRQRVHGLEPEMLAKFPIIRYASIKAPKKGKAGGECAVCLLQFEENEKLRLLPPCGHLFHAECIDMWLQTHSTCPLCRRNLDGDGASGHLQRALSAVVNSFRRDPNSNSLAEGRAADPDLEAGQDEAEAGNGSSRRREIARTLSKNSESFKMGAHDQELRELREKLRATSARFSKDDPAREPSRMRSFLSFRSTATTDVHHSQSLVDLRAESPTNNESPEREAPDEADHGHSSVSLRRSVSDGESFSIANHKLWMGESSTLPSTNRPAFSSFARRSLKWLVGSASKDSSSNQGGSMQQQVDKSGPL